MRGLQSVATTMGFSALDGLMMGTRCGSIDAGVLLHLLQVERWTLADVVQLLYRESGLLGVSGVSAEPARPAGRRGDEPSRTRRPWTSTCGASCARSAR